MERREAGAPRIGAESRSPLGPASRPFAFCLLLLAACGYRFGGIVEHPRVTLTMFDNLTERRTHEVDLTEAVAREMTGAGIAVNASDAPVELTGRIVDFREPPVVETGKDEVLVSSVVIQLEISLRRRSDGSTLWTHSRTESASFARPGSDSREAGRQEVFDRLARWVVTKLEKEW